MLPRPVADGGLHDAGPVAVEDEYRVVAGEHRAIQEQVGGLEPLGPQRRHALGAGATRLRGLLRLSLMDDNDLQLAQRALREAAAFFEALRAAAAHAGRKPHALWASLQQPVNARG